MLLDATDTTDKTTLYLLTTETKHRSLWSENNYRYTIQIKNDL